MNQISTRILLLLFSFSSLVVATNFTRCLEDFKKNPDAVGGVDSQGHPTNSTAAIGFTYKACTEQCGSSPAAFNWREFSQLFCAWLLPWLALLSQLPFGSGNLLDDFTSIVMSVGSPALAAYSLILTALNARSVNRRVNRIKYKNKTVLARALISLQQLSLELTKDPILLASIPIDNQWEQEIVSRLNRRNTWSIATASSISWVIISFLFTLADSFNNLNNPPNTKTLDNSIIGKSSPYAIGTLWLWLVCLVIGWMWVPTFTRGELRSALEYANEKAAKKTAKRIRQASQGGSQAINSANAEATDNSLEGVEVLRASGEHTIEVVEEDEKVKDGLVQEVDKHAEQKTDQETDSSQLASEGQRSCCHPDDSESQSSASKPQPARGAKLLILKDSSSLNLDESRRGVMFNYARGIRFLVLVEDVSRMFDKSSRREGDEQGEGPPIEGAVFPPGALTSMFNASIFGLVLQFGITGAATIVMAFNTIDNSIGCRCLGYIIYGTIALVIMYLTIASTILAHISETRRGRSTIVRDSTARFAIFLRWFCFSLALFNAVGLLVLSTFHFSNLLNNCYCNAIVIIRGKDSYIPFSYLHRIPVMRSARIAGTVFAGGTMTFYMSWLWRLIPSLGEHASEVPVAETTPGKGHEQ